MSKKISEQDIKQLMKLKPGTSRKAAVEYAKMLADLGMSVKDAIKRAGMKTQYSKNAALSSRTKYKYVPNKPPSKKSSSKKKATKSAKKKCPKARKPRTKCKYGTGNNGNYKAPKGCKAVPKCNRRKPKKSSKK